jgi:hypothetical protein
MITRFLVLSALFCFQSAFASIQIDGNVAAGQGSSINHISSPAFSTSSTNELVLAFVAAGFKSGKNTVVKNVSGGGLTWSLVKRVNVQRGTAEIWKAISPGLITNANIQANFSQKAPASITVLSFSGVDISNPTGATGGGSSASGPPTASLTTTRPESFVIGIGIDPTGAAPRTPDAGQILIHQYLSTSTFWVQSQATITPAAFTNVTINDTAPANRAYNLAIVEVVADSNPAPASNISGNIQSANGAPLGGVSVQLVGTNTDFTTTTDSSGNYTFQGIPNGNYEVTPTFAGMTFDPESQSVTVNGADVTANFVEAVTTPSTYSISGSVSGGAGASIQLTGPNGSSSTNADASGNYALTGIPDGTYTVTPTLSGSTFTPASRSVTVNGADVPGVNFVGTVTPPATYSVSGNVSVTGAGVSVVLSGSNGNLSATTDASGNFIFSGVQNGTYTVTPSSTGKTFSPVNRSIAVNGANVTGVNFVGTVTPPATYSISGNVSVTGAGVTVQLSGGTSLSTVTDASGNYSFSGVQNGTYTVTPSSSGKTFSPTSRSVTVNGANVTGINFAGTVTTYSISGTVSLSASALSGVTVTLSGASGASTTTDTSGAYVFSGLANGTYVVTPSRAGYTFNPVNVTVVVNGSNRGSINFAATAIVTSHQVTLAWDAPTTYADGNPLTETVFYRIHYGTTSQNYTSSVDAQSATQFTVTGLPSGTYYFAVTAYLAGGATSGYSSEVTTGLLAKLYTPTGLLARNIHNSKEFKVVIPADGKSGD